MCWEGLRFAAVDDVEDINVVVPGTYLMIRESIRQRPRLT